MDRVFKKCTLHLKNCRIFDWIAIAFVCGKENYC